MPFSCWIEIKLRGVRNSLSAIHTFIFSIFYHEHVLTKQPGTAKVTPWHHDQSYYPIDGDQIVSMWIPVDFVGLDAAIRFVKGSHSWNRYQFLELQW